MYKIRFDDNNFSLEALTSAVSNVLKVMSTLIAVINVLIGPKETIFEEKKNYLP